MTEPSTTKDQKERPISVSGLVMKLAGLQRYQASISSTLLTTSHIASLLGCFCSLSTDFFGGHLSTLVLSVFWSPLQLMPHIHSFT